MAQVLSSLILVGEKQQEIARARFCLVAQKLVNSWSIPRQLPIRWEVGGAFLAIVLWQHPRLVRGQRSYRARNPENFKATKK